MRARRGVGAPDGAGGAVWLSILLPFIASGCGSMGRSQAYPLHARKDRPSPQEVALLNGPIAQVDGRSVAGKGRTFELLPGCHVVTLQRTIGGSDSAANGAWFATIPQMVVAFEMKPAHRYTIEQRLQESSGPTGSVVIVAHERAPDGQVVVVPWAGSQGNIDECRKWAARNGWN